MSSSRLLLALTLLLATPAACKKDKPAEPAVHVKGTPHTDQVLAAWSKAGLVPDGFAPMTPKLEHAAYCELGKVNAVDTTVCEFENDQALQLGQQKVREAWARIDAHTGVIVRAKRTMLAVVDRERREPSGKTINQIINVFSAMK